MRLAPNAATISAKYNFNYKNKDNFLQRQKTDKVKLNKAVVALNFNEGRF